MGCVVRIVGCELGVEIRRGGTTEARTKFSTCFDTSSHAVHDEGGIAHMAGDGGVVERVERVDIWPSGPDVVRGTSMTCGNTSVRFIYEGDGVEGEFGGL